MGDGADFALDRGFEDFAFDDLADSLSKSEQFEHGLIDERGFRTGKPWIPPCESAIKPSGPGPCPQCGGNTTLRKNRHTGAEFYGCVKFPNCRGNRDS